MMELRVINPYCKWIVLCSLSLLTACHSKSDQHLTGYIEGEYTYISSAVPGTLKKIVVKRGQPVHAGSLLYQLQPQPEVNQLEAAQARVEELQVQLLLSSLQFQRQIQLFQTHATSRVAYDTAQTAFHSRQHQLLEAKSDEKQIRWAYDQKTQVAPAAGIIFDVFFRVGENVAANKPVLALLTPDNIRVLFYVPEPLLSQIKLGQTIAFNCDHCKKTQAKISYISPEAEYTPPIVYSKDSRQKLVYLVRADMPADIAESFHPGQPVDVMLNAN